MGGVILFTRLLAEALEEGLKLDDAVKQAHDKFVGDEVMEGVVTVITGKVADGETLAEALTGYPDIFEPYYVELVKAGEAGGALEFILRRIVAMAEAPLKTEEAQSLLLLGVLIGCGVPIIECLTLAAGVCKTSGWKGYYLAALADIRNPPDESVIEQTFEDLKKVAEAEPGEVAEISPAEWTPLADAFAYGDVPEGVYNLIREGELEGTLDENLEKAARLFEDGAQ